MKLANNNNKLSFTALILSVISIFSSVSADDTEVFITSSSALNPNVLFIMDNSTSMDGPSNPQGSPLIDGKTRIQIMKEALFSVLSTADNNLNVGITNYGHTSAWRNDNANGIKFPITPLNTLVKPIIEESLKDKAGDIQWRHHRQPAPAGNGMKAGFNPVVSGFDDMTVRDYIPEIAKLWQAKGNTPIVDALFEAALYFRGGPIWWRDVSGYGGRADYLASAHPSTYRYPEGVYHESEKYPNKEYPYVPQWYADNQSIDWKSRSTDEDGWYLDYLKSAATDWFTGWIKCPANTGATGSPKYTAIANSGPSSLENCRVMRNDFVRYLQSVTGNKFNAAVNGMNNGKSSWWIDTRIKKETQLVSPATWTSIASEVVTKAPTTKSPLISRKVYKFDDFPRCRVIEHISCAANGSDSKDKYLCKTTGSEECRSWNYEQCSNPADAATVHEIICDFDQNTSRYPSPNYTTPVSGDCQSNFIVLMSDGKPEYSDGDRLSLKATSSIYRSNIPDMTGLSCADDPYFVAGTCGPELTHFLATTDQLPGNDTATTGNQFINTMVIGFSNTVSSDLSATNYLKSLVTVEDTEEKPGKDGFFIANNKAELVQAFTDALSEIVVSARSQASPGYSVNVKSGLEHEDNVFIPVFEKMNSETWRGNLKKFKLINTSDGHRHIRGKTEGVDAMSELGLFTDDAWDYWSESPTADGKNVAQGGVASLIDNPSQRKVFSNITGDRNVNLWSEDNLLQAKNNLIQNSWMSLGTDEPVNGEYRKKLIRYARGWKQGEVAQGARKFMGDMLHSEPVIITYDSGDENGVGKKQYIFAGTNEGYLHAFDTTTGEEKFAFMPRKLLKNLYRQLVGNDGAHIYGIDGDISYVKNGDDVYLYFGLRRGGKSYYALDISNINEPKLMWTIDGETNTHFSHLGQTWSSTYITNVNVGTTKKTAIVFTGGYDTKFDYGDGDRYDLASVTDNREADIGNDIYIVNAKTGDRLWSMRETMGNEEVKHAIPGGARILDTDNNGVLDRLYFADTGGNVWRLDLHEDLSAPTKSTLQKIASLSGEGVNRRKFFTEPDVARLTENGHEIFTISLGSGLRSHPLNEEITDHMFVLLEKNPLTPLKSMTGDDAYKAIRFNDNDLANVKVEATINSETNNITKTLTHNGFKNGTKDVANILHAKDTDSNVKRGWYVKFPDTAEKVLSTSITFEGSLVFTTFVPKAITTGEGISACSSPGTQGRIYAMNILTGEANMNIIRGDSTINDNDVFSTISANEIPGKPQRIFNSLDCTDGNCEHNVDIRIGKKDTEVSSEDVSNVESIYWIDPH